MKFIDGKARSKFYTRMLSGFGNYFTSEALEGALPQGQNSPQNCPFGLYAEQFSGTAFTAPQQENRRTWLYRILPSAQHKPFVKTDSRLLHTSPSDKPTTPNQLRWEPLPKPKTRHNFIEGLVTFCTTGNAEQRAGSALHLYTANTSMTDTYFYNADGEMLFVPEKGEIKLKTECGLIALKPLEIAVIPRGLIFQVELVSDWGRGYVCENFGAPFTLIDRGPIGANGLANSRDFLTPTAWYEEKKGDFKLLNKFQNHLWVGEIDHSPLNVVAWHGNNVPYKYDLKNFQVINSVSFDHPDPSIFTVLTSPAEKRGTANVDFVIFPPRWVVAEHSFRPPYYHRNVMSEYMGLLLGVYDAKEGGGFVPGGGSLHNCFAAHGPDAASFAAATESPLKPVYKGDTMAIMFESRTVYHPTEFAMNTELLQKDYFQCWQGLTANFKGK